MCYVSCLCQSIETLLSLLLFHGFSSLMDSEYAALAENKMALETALKQYMDNMLAFEGMLKIKEQEKTDLLASYRSLTLSSTEMQSRALDAVDHASSIDDKVM